jgi:PAT family beta-lactamase induction signal transducer AmpG
MSQRPATALSTSAPLRYGTFGALYFAQGIPQGLWLFAIPAWLAMNDVDAALVGSYIGICTLPWTFKLLVGPLMDRYSFLPMGRRRPWLLSAQLGLLVMMLLLAFVPDPLNNMALFMAVSFVLNCFGAVQDVATDGMAVDITPVDQQARANGVMWGAKVIGMGATLTVGTWAINMFGFTSAVVGLAASMVLVLILPSMLRERQGERLFPWSHGEACPETVNLQVENWGEILLTLRSAFFLRNSLIGALCILLVGTANGVKDALVPVFTIQQLGWDNSAYADLVASANVISAVAAMLLAGWLADRVGKVRIISIYIVVLLLGWTALGSMWIDWSTPGFIHAFVYGVQFLDTFLIVAILATAMNLCWTRVAATQFTLYMVCNNLGFALGAMLLGPLRAQLSWSGMFFFITALLAVALLLLQLMRLRMHRDSLGRLEEYFAEKAARKALENKGGLPVDLGIPGSVG